MESVVSYSNSLNHTTVGDSIFLFFFLTSSSTGKCERGGSDSCCFACFDLMHCSFSFLIPFSSLPTGLMPVSFPSSCCLYVQQLAVYLHQHIGCFYYSRSDFLASHFPSPWCSHYVFSLFLMSWSGSYCCCKIRRRKACNYTNFRLYLRGFVCQGWRFIFGNFGNTLWARAFDLNIYPGLWWDRMKKRLYEGKECEYSPRTAQLADQQGALCVPT